MTDTQRRWDRLPTKTPKSYAAFRAYCEMGLKRSVREVARQHCVKTASSGPKIRRRSIGSAGRLGTSG